MTEDGYGSRLVADNVSGCEVMYINSAEPGSFKLYVNNYTDSRAGNYSSDTMSVLNIHIYIYDSTGLIAEYIFPAGQAGVVWEVLDISGSQLTPSRRVYSSLAGKTWWLENKGAAARTTWLEVKGLTITPQGEFTYWWDSSAYQRRNIVITETTEGVPDGFKQVTATIYTIDHASFDRDSDKFYIADLDNYLSWSGVLDRYTGQAFEFYQESPSDDVLGEIRDENGVLAIGYQSVSLEDGTSITTITCPIGYDGLVFQVGPMTAEDYARRRTMDFTVSHTMDEFTSNLGDFYYFSYSND